MAFSQSAVVLGLGRGPGRGQHELTESVFSTTFRRRVSSGSWDQDIAWVEFISTTTSPYALSQIRQSTASKCLQRPVFIGRRNCSAFTHPVRPRPSTHTAESLGCRSHGRIELPNLGLLVFARSRQTLLLRPAGIHSLLSVVRFHVGVRPVMYGSSSFSKRKMSVSRTINPTCARYITSPMSRSLLRSTCLVCWLAPLRVKPVRSKDQLKALRSLIVYLAGTSTRQNNAPFKDAPS